MLDISWEEFKRKYPNLAREIEEKTMCISIGGIRWENGENYDELRNPDVVSFLRRCDTDEEAYEVIDYLERRGEISREYAESVRRQVREKGVRSFGSRKPMGYYLMKYYYGEDV
ncbi:DUF2095 family protein [Candidatus Bathyarchaeota archaeon]|nr:DUF2095 family protein [Candidatus Bathyarchaeota archaeon]